MSTHQPMTKELQIPYGVYMKLKPYIPMVSDIELDNYIEWCEDMALLGGCPFITYYMGSMKLNPVFGYLYTTKFAADLLFTFAK